MIGNATNKPDSPNNILLIDKQVSRLFKSFAYDSAADINLSEKQISKTMQVDRFLGRSEKLVYHE